MSIDRPYSLADVLEIPVPGEIIPLFDRLDVWQLDMLALVEDKFRGMSALLAAAGSHEHDSLPGMLEPEELTGSLGIGDILGLAEVVRVSSSGEYDVVIVDCPPAAEAVRIFGAPAMVSQYLERVWPRHRRLSAVAAHDVRLMLLVSVLERIASSVDQISGFIGGGTATTVHLVTAPTSASVLTIRRTLSALALSALPVDRIIVNAVVPEFISSPGSDVVVDPNSRWLANVRDQQLAVIDSLRTTAAGVTVDVVEHVGREPVGLASLGEMAVALGNVWTEPKPHPQSVTVVLESGSGLDSVYSMRMHLPLVDPSSLTLGRVEDDVVVGADGVRRRVTLASVLRRCVVSGAELDGTDLIIRFRPDSAVWPA